MENYQLAYLLTLLVQIIISVIILLRQGYYLKKGQNAADKEDIAELTKIVESVKTEFIRKNAKITSDLDVLKDRRGKSYTQAQQAIINCFADLQSFISYSMDISIRQISQGRAEEALITIREKRNKVDASLTLVELLVDGDKSRQIGGDVAFGILRLTDHIEQSLVILLRFITAEQRLPDLLNNQDKLTTEEIPPPATASKFKT
jgi:competence protein ComGC